MQDIKQISMDIDSPIRTKIDAKQNDTLSRFVEFSLFKNNFNVDLAGHTVKIYAIKSDSNIIFNNVTIEDITNGKVMVELTSQALAVVGDLNCELVIYGSDNSILSSKLFVVNVIKSIRNDAAIESANEFSALTAMMGAVQGKLDNGEFVGEQGAQGTIGNTGATGAQGIQGEKGTDGAGTGDMLESIYDTTGNGKVDDSEKLGGNDPSYYTKQEDFTTYSDENTMQLNDVKIKIDSLVPKRHTFGGQIAKLIESLSNPLEQITGIVFIGDSIMWGRALLENGVFDPRDGTLSDPRDVFVSPSFVNEFKRYIGKQYAFGAAPILSNWSASPSGQAKLEYITQKILYPKDGDFSLVTTGTSTSVDEALTGASITGSQLRLGVANTGTGVHTVSFPFTGESFLVSFAGVANAMDYEVFVDGVSKGVFSTTAGVDGVTATNNNQRTHTFGYVRNKVVQIKTKLTTYVGTQYFRFEAIIINKKIRITNQGINGATTSSYKLYNLAGNTFGDGVAVGVNDNYTFVQLGTNDRIIRADTPKGTNKFKANLKLLLDLVTPLSNVVLMCANPVIDESSLLFGFNMQDVRSVIYQLAKANNIDMIDNYTIFSNLDLSLITDDGLHPNELGHQIIAKNIINSLSNN